jgi:hypothetical protein
MLPCPIVHPESQKPVAAWKSIRAQEQFRLFSTSCQGVIPQNIT